MVIMILGCSGRIGFSLTQELLKGNHKLILADKIISLKLKTFLSQIPRKNFYVKKVDLNNEKKIQFLLKESLARFDKIDSAVNCIYPVNKAWGKYSLNDINKKHLNLSFSEHLSNLVIIIKNISKVFIKQKYGNMILISSIQGLSAPKFEHYKGTKMSSAIEYSIIKAGIINMTKYLAKYFKGKNIRFNCISPGGIKDNQPRSFVQKYKKSCLSKGLLESKDLLSAFKFLLSEETKYINGQNIIIDDGWSL